MTKISLTYRIHLKRELKQDYNDALKIRVLLFLALVLNIKY